MSRVCGTTIPWKFVEREKHMSAKVFQSPLIGQICSMENEHTYIYKV